MELEGSQVMVEVGIFFFGEEFLFIVLSVSRDEVILVRGIFVNIISDFDFDDGGQELEERSNINGLKFFSVVLFELSQEFKEKLGDFRENIIIGERDGVEFCVESF